LELADDGCGDALRVFSNPFQNMLADGTASVEYLCPIHSTTS